MIKSGKGIGSNLPVEYSSLALKLTLKGSVRYLVMELPQHVRLVFSSRPLLGIAFSFCT